MYKRQDFYRHARYVHGWLSAFAFLILIFFATTGLILNNPDWFKAANDEVSSTVTLSSQDAKLIKAQENPSTLIIEKIRSQANILGRFKSSEVIDTDVMIRLESPSGSTDITYALDRGQAEIIQKPATVVSTLNDLHRGKNAGTAWHWLIDISSILILSLSIAGFILFLSIKARLKTHLILTGLSIIVMALLIWIAL